MKKIMISNSGVTHIALVLAVILGAAVPLAACICPEEGVCCKESAECRPLPTQTAAEPDACGASCCGGEKPVSGGDTASGLEESGACHCRLFPLERLAATPPAVGGATPDMSVFQLPAPSILAPHTLAVVSAGGEFRPPGDSTPLHVRVCAWRC